MASGQSNFGNNDLYAYFYTHTMRWHILTIGFSTKFGSTAHYLIVNGKKVVYVYICVWNYVLKSFSISELRLVMWSGLSSLGKLNEAVN